MHKALLLMLEEIASIDLMLLLFYPIDYETKLL